MEYIVGDIVRLRGGVDEWEVEGVFQPSGNYTINLISSPRSVRRVFSHRDLELVRRAKTKKLVPHWPAVRKVMGDYKLTDELFPSLEFAKQRWKSAIRLADEYPPVMIEVES